MHDLIGIAKLMLETDVWETAFYLLALINPISKIMFLATYEPPLSLKQNWELSWKSSITALSILLVLAAAGQFILNKIFRIQLCALEITGGIILFMLGLLAVQEGRFINKKIQSLQNLTELSIVPLAAPLIAGPGTITAVIAESISKGFLPTSVALIITTIVNFLLMAAARQINFVLIKMHLQGPLIRFTGLIIAAVSVQMVINGLRHCIL